MGRISMPNPKQYEYPDGSKYWYLNGYLHRENGPAVEYPNGYKAWCLNGTYHRLDGPARIWGDGYKEWWLNGKEYTEEEYVMIQFMNGKNVYKI